MLLAQLRRVWGCFFARENARLKLAHLALATGAGHCTHAAARGLNRAQRARRDSEYFLLCYSFGVRGAAPSWRTSDGWIVPAAPPRLLGCVVPAPTRKVPALPPTRPPLLWLCTR